jgi:haloalkane dehalogenase
MSEPSWNFHYPFASHFLKIDGFKYHYLDEGSGPPLLMVHGNPTWSFYWRKLVSTFRDRYRVVAVDHLGCGLSETPSEAAYPYTLESRIDNLQQLVERLELRNITLAAHDWGGAIGMGTALRMPERFSRFIFFNTAVFRSRRCPWRIRICRTPLLGRLAVQGGNLFARAALRMATEKPTRFPPQVRSGYLAPYDNWHRRTAIYRFVQDIPLHPSHPTYSTLEQIEKQLSNFRNHPMCLIWGMRDWCFSPHFLERFQEFFPEAEVHPIDDAGHYVVEDADQQIVPILESFLSGNKD